MAHIESYVNNKYTAIDTDALTFTEWVDVTTCDHISIYVEGKTGDHANHKIGIQMSPDGIFNGGFHMEDGGMVLITGAGHSHVHDVSSMEFVRLSVQTIEGATSTCDLYLQAFRHKD